jgi:hypothetical protein
MSAIPYHVQTMRERCHVNHVMVRPILDLPLLFPIKTARYWSTMDKVSFHLLNQQVYLWSVRSVSCHWGGHCWYNPNCLITLCSRWYSTVHMHMSGHRIRQNPPPSSTWGWDLSSPSQYAQSYHMAPNPTAPYKYFKIYNMC